MLKIVVCCLGGFSSGAIVSRLNKEIREKGWENKVSIDFLGFGSAIKVLNQYDIAICCPHLRLNVKDFIDKENPNIPVHILPPRIYALMNLEGIVSDCQKLIKIYEEEKINPVHFPGEENVLRVTRSKAY